MEFDFYEIEWQLGSEPFRYSFEIKSGEQIWFYNRYGVSDRREDYYAYMIVPGFKTPEWPKARSCTRFLWIASAMGILTMSGGWRIYLYWRAEQEDKRLESGAGSPGHS